MREFNLPYNYQPRHYQHGLMQAMTSKDKGGLGLLRALCVWHRRAGKDKTFINILGAKSIERVGTYYYYFPTQSLGRKIIWEGMDKDGFRFVDHFPKDYIQRVSERDMSIEFANHSRFQLIGTDQLDIVGTNPVGCVFSEYSKQNPKAWQYIQPILRENGGWAIFNGTPRGRNHMWQLLDKTKGLPDWYTELLTIEDTGAVRVEDVEADIAAGLISQEMAMQEYYCSFDLGIEGSYYTSYISKAEKDGRIRTLVVDENYPVYTAWDLGIDNAMAIWFFQLIERDIRLIDHYENTNEGLGHYAKILKEKGYTYGGHYAPWDVVKRESNGVTVQRNAEKVGIFFERVKRTSAVSDDIELVKRNFSRFIFDGYKCSYGINCMRQYHQKKDEKMSLEGRPVFMNKPDHDWTSNTADAMRTLVRACELGMARSGTMGQVRSLQMSRPESYLEDQKPKVPLWYREIGNKRKQPLKDSYL